MNPHDVNLKQTPAPTGQSPPLLAPPGSDTMRTSIFLPPLLPGADQGPPLPMALSAPPSAFTLWRAFLRRWPLALGAGVLVAGLAVAAAFLLSPAKYHAHFWIKINAAKPVGPMLGQAEDADFQVFKSFQSVLVKSRPVVHRALETPMNGKFVKEFSIVREQTDPVDWLQSVKTDFHPQSPEIMRVAFSSLEQPEELALLMNALARSLIEENSIMEKAKHNALIDQTVAKERENQKLLENKNRILQVRMGGRADENAQAKKLDQLEQELRDARTAFRLKQLELITAENKLKSWRERMANPDASTIPPSVITDILKQDTAAVALLKQMDDAFLNYTNASRVSSDPGSPLLRSYLDKKLQAERQLEAYKQQNMPTIVRKYQERMAIEGSVEFARLKDDVTALKEQEKLLDDNITRLDAEIARVRPSAGLPLEVLALKKEIETLEKAQQTIGGTIALMKVNEPLPRVSILQDAIEPAARDYSRLVKLAGAGGGGAFLLTVLAVSFFEFRSRKISGSDEVSRGLGLTLIGSVPALPDNARPPLAQGKVDPYWQNQLMESVDTIRTMLLYGARSNNTRVIMVSSAGGGEGKTSLASQLAGSLARAWKKTLLIDGDLRSPAAHKLFDVPQEPGLSEVLRGELGASEAVRSTPLSRLWIMPAGHWDSHAVQALAQDGVRTLLEELKQQYDFIILDSSPILPVADGLLLGQNVDGVLLAVMRDHSRSPAVYAAQQRLEGLGIKVLGAVMIGARNELGFLGNRYASQARP